MDEAGFNQEKVIDYWIKSSDDDFETMTAMFDSKRYAWSLFVGHLMIEKLLKAMFVKINNEFPPFTHNLLRLAEKSSIELTEERKLFLLSVTAFNINGRYDDYKMSFQKTCTPEFTRNWIERLKENRLWIKDLIKH
ncbi:HEPN domain-containing protein [Dyadobacter sp. LJ53]|uniref:HEPN domain-containing protein n=1 Tax=Dyadobacter chenwenxiniae TaxID=2906456 RepID=UPI001F3D8D94|nr:HEPN domain-containing protein [Dyadobacter chenwenxiniae]MCF0049980.1 HEPN domain-containing protein [Dyadobacter chenwenxiniae]